ncbi:uncharacterized protein Tco025E_03232 [Trypanosoma conorhini]|uniref:Uncharacterized protein n=1 Tax=Trypanosoma conorhini TaxID=83891 RepID=A0A422PW19_9TRYP|nr:uncharacterized protein Tco025E_03232 [Trypanosoma conorhini]RNF21902.1 hypothetical protein Tco025E_03232 [Trypanosoma conorhini]
MFTPSPRGGSDDPSALASSVSTRRVAAELLAAHAGESSPHPPSAGGARTRGAVAEATEGASRGGPPSFQQETLFEVADVWHEASPPMTAPRQPPHSSPPSSSAWPMEAQAVRTWQAEFLQREESLVRREMEAFAREERLAQRVATDACRQRLHEAKSALEKREREVAQQVAAQREEKELLDARTAELDRRERELEEEQERLLNDTREQVERIHSSACVLQEKESAVAQREESCSHRAAELMLQRECLLSWEASLRRQQCQLDAQQASVAEKLAAAQELLSRESNLEELELRLREREASLWEAAAAKVPGDRGELKRLLDTLRRLQGELHSCEPTGNTSSEVL